MGVLEIFADQGEVVIDHAQGAMAKDALEGEGISAVTQIFDSEGMAEAMRADPRDPGFIAKAGEQLLDGVAIHGLPVFSDEKRI